MFVGVSIITTFWKYRSHSSSNVIDLEKLWPLYQKIIAYEDMTHLPYICMLKNMWNLHEKMVRESRKRGFGFKRVVK